MTNPSSANMFQVSPFFQEACQSAVVALLVLTLATVSAAKGIY